jgi:acyl-CoA thioester hydrolase
MGASGTSLVESVETLAAGPRNRARHLTAAVGRTAQYVALVRLNAEPSLDVDAYPFHHRIRVRFSETDAMGIVHHSRYLPYLEEARVAYLRHVGHPYAQWRAAGVDTAVLECFVQYRSPLQFDDEVDVHLRLATATRTTFQMTYLLTVRGAIRATGVTVHGCVTGSGVASRLPGWLTELAAR